MNDLANKIWSDAVHKYQNDPEFHAKVEQAIQILRTTRFKELVKGDFNIAALRGCVALGLIMGETELETLLKEEN